MEKLIALIIILLIAMAVIVGLAALTALPVMLLWNWLMPVIFGLPEVGFFQAWGLMVLCGFFFKSTQQKSKEE